MKRHNEKKRQGYGQNNRQNQSIFLLRSSLGLSKCLTLDMSLVADLSPLRGYYISKKKLVKNL